MYNLKENRSFLNDVLEFVKNSLFLFLVLMLYKPFRNTIITMYNGGDGSPLGLAGLAIKFSILSFVFIVVGMFISERSTEVTYKRFDKKRWGRFVQFLNRVNVGYYREGTYIYLVDLTQDNTPKIVKIIDEGNYKFKVVNRYNGLNNTNKNRKQNIEREIYKLTSYHQ